jgi:hypothetical protein
MCVPVLGVTCQRGQRLPLRFSLLQICPSDLVRTRTREHATIPAVALPSARLNKLQILAVTVTAVKENNAGGMPDASFMCHACWPLCVARGKELFMVCGAREEGEEQQRAVKRCSGGRWNPWLNVTYENSTDDEVIDGSRPSECLPVSVFQ